MTHPPLTTYTIGLFKYGRIVEAYNAVSLPDTYQNDAIMEWFTRLLCQRVPAPPEDYYIAWDKTSRKEEA